MLIFSTNYDEKGNPVLHTYKNHYRSFEYDENGNTIGELKEVVDIYQYKAEYECK